ncbi:MAG: hypothetical protein E7626_05355 [Ruminococcaceae bacterium]|nr:hypothetical protein [Oscillospiraceae bacterium]
MEHGYAVRTKGHTTATGELLYREEKGADAFFGAVSPKVRVLEHGYAVRTKGHTTATGELLYREEKGADAFFGAVSPKVRVLEHGYAVRTKGHTMEGGKWWDRTAADRKDAESFVEKTNVKR